MLKKIKKELDTVVNAREKAIRLQRDIIPLCADAIKAVHGGRIKTAESKLKNAEKKIRQAEAILKGQQAIINSILGTCYQEYAELSILISYLKGKGLPTLKIPLQYYLTGLGDAIGELKRYGLDLLAKGKIKEAEKLEKELEDLYHEYRALNYPNALVPGLKRKQDVARRVINDLHDVISSAKVRR